MTPVALHELQMELQKEQRRHQEEQLAFSKQSLETSNGDGAQPTRIQHECS